jgi:hypothetical protein
LHDFAIFDPNKLTMSKVYCPSCEAIFRYHPDFCDCGYPINGSELDQYIFVSKQMEGQTKAYEGNRNAMKARKKGISFSYFTD